MIAHLRHSIKPPFMGGMEAHSDLLVRELVRAGHAPTLFASGDSAADLPLHPICPQGYQHELPWEKWHGTPTLAAWLGKAYGRAWEAIREGQFDVVHNNTLSPDIHQWALADRIPTVTTLHVPPFASLATAVAMHAAPWHQLTVPSHDQVNHWIEAAGDRLTVVANGIDLGHWLYKHSPGKRAIWFGRINPNKGTAEALRAATAARIGLDVAGPIEDAAYFESLRSLWGGGHRYVGHLAGADLVAAVGQASVALCTPLWDEPFGLVAAEALACGTPVAALNRGALSEVVGDCGAIVQTAAQLPSAIERALAIPRAACRRRVEERFGADTMVRAYLPVYAASIASASSAANIRAELA